MAGLVKIFLICLLSHLISSQICKPLYQECVVWNDCCSGCCKGICIIDNDCDCNPCAPVECMQPYQCVIISNCTQNYCPPEGLCVQEPSINDINDPCETISCLIGSQCYLTIPKLYNNNANDRPEAICARQPFCPIDI